MAKMFAYNHNTPQLILTRDLFYMSYSPLSHATTAPALSSYPLQAKTKFFTAECILNVRKNEKKYKKYNDSG